MGVITIAATGITHFIQGSYAFRISEGFGWRVRLAQAGFYLSIMHADGERAKAFQHVPLRV